MIAFYVLSATLLVLGRGGPCLVSRAPRETTFSVGSGSGHALSYRKAMLLISLLV